MRTRILLVLLVIVVGACEVAVDENVTPPEVVDTPVVDDVVSAANNPVEPTVAIMSNHMPAGAFGLFVDALGKDLQWYSLFTIDRLGNYDQVIVFYTTVIEQQLKTAGYDWPPLKPYEAVRIAASASTQLVLVNATDSRFLRDLIPLLLNGLTSVQQVPVALFQTASSSAGNYLPLPPSACRIPQRLLDNVVVGFPMLSERLPSTGVVHAKVVYLEFADYRMSVQGEVLEKLYEPYGTNVNRYYEQMSYGTMSFLWDVHPEPLLMPKPAAEYALTRAGNRPGYYPTLEIVYEMLALHKDAVDFTDVSLIIVMFNPALPRSLSDVSPAHPVGRSRPFVTNQGEVYNATTIGSDIQDGGYKTVAHEIGHLLGLIDLYDYDQSSDQPWHYSHRHVGGHDIMGNLWGSNIEMLGWNRYLLDWLDASDVRCMDPLEEVAELLVSSVSSTTGERIIVVPLSDSKVLVVEAREVNRYCLTCDGLLVYTVDTRIANGRGAIQVQRPLRSSDVMYDDGMVRFGETIEVGSIRIALSQVSPGGYVVQISRSSPTS